MGLRETLNRNPGITTVGTALIIVAALVFVVLAFMRGETTTSGPSSRVWYTSDDGQSWFADDRYKLPPFDHNGRQAVRAYLFTCDGGENLFVGYLQRFSAEAKKLIEEERARAGGPVYALEVEGRTGIEIKKPKTGDDKWVKETDPAARAILDVTCPDGTTNNLQAVADP